MSRKARKSKNYRRRSRSWNPNHLCGVVLVNMHLQSFRVASLATKVLTAAHELRVVPGMEALGVC